MNPFIWLLLVLTFNFGLVQAKEPFTYEDKGRRDPLRPLVDNKGRYLLSAELHYSSGELDLFGILWDPRGDSSALINNEVVKVGESISGFIIKDITEDSVTVSKDGKEHLIKVIVEQEE